MAFTLYQSIIDKLQGINRIPFVPQRVVQAQNTGIMRPFSFGMIYECNYRNFKKDPHPLTFILYSDVNETHAINIHALDGSSSAWLMRIILAIYRAQQITNGKTLYYGILKPKNALISKKAYRTYKTNMLYGKLVSTGIIRVAIPVNPSMEPFVNTINRAQQTNPGGIDRTSTNQNELEQRLEKFRKLVPNYSKMTVNEYRAPLNPRMFGG
jgi:hypothetical protein